jgi:hypothetical protein
MTSWSPLALVVTVLLVLVGCATTPILMRNARSGQTTQCGPESAALAEARRAASRRRRRAGRGASLGICRKRGSRFSRSFPRHRAE